LKDFSTLHINSWIDSYNIKYHQFADDTRLFVTLDTIDSAQTVSHLSLCTGACREDIFYRATIKSQVGIWIMDCTS